MSFLFARNYKNKIYILSDTKVSFESSEEQEIFRKGVLNGSEDAYKKLDKFGVIKSVIINDNICVAFAGNLKHFNELLEYIENNNITDIDNINKKAKHINISCSGNTDFIVASTSVSNKELFLIQEGRIRRVSSCWIGSPDTAEIFEKKRKELIASDDYSECKCTKIEKEDGYIEVSNPDFQCLDITAFRYAVKNTTDETVGGFIISCTGSNGFFMYMEEYETNVEKKRTVGPDGIIQLFDNAEDGGYAFHFYESTNMVSMYIYQMKKGVIYRPYLVDNDYNHLRFPTMYDCSEKEFIKEKII